MGEEIVQQESRQVLGKHTRLRDYVDACTVLTGDTVRDRNFDPILALSGAIPAVLKTLG